MPLNIPSQTPDDQYYYTEEFKVLVRSLKDILRGDQLVAPLTDRALVYSCRNNIYKLLRELGVGPELYWATAYINDIEDPFQDITHLEHIYMIDESTLLNSLSRSNTVHG